MLLDLLQLLFIIGEGKALVVQGQGEHHYASQQRPYSCLV